MDPLWRCLLGLLVIGCRLKLSRSTILDSIYWNTSNTNTFEGLDNHEGGVCRTKSMKMVLRVGQSPESVPTKDHSPKHSDTDNQSTFSKEDEVISKAGMYNNINYGADGKSGESTGPSSSEMVLFAGVASGVVVLVLLLVVGLVVLIRQRRHRKHAAQCSGPLPLHTLPKRGSGGANNNGSEPSDIIFPLRSSDSMYCPHYEKVSGDYGHPVYIVQEMPPQSPANIYYKV
uniref:Ephrin-B2b n=1 Tax=Astyanax mexicanus TaxID=7994 RepID=A0A3B1IMG3_ASTMX